MRGGRRGEREAEREGRKRARGERRKEGRKRGRERERERRKRGREDERREGGEGGTVEGRGGGGIKEGNGNAYTNHYRNFLLLHIQYTFMFNWNPDEVQASNVQNEPFLFSPAVIPSPPPSIVFLHISDDGVFDEGHLIGSHGIVVIQSPVEGVELFVV